ncbi:MAG: ribonuclease HII [Oscillospiraceae bacterium]|nr:ribonuclease HII [Oscillospiraceae bacterium]
MPRKKLTPEEERARIYAMQSIEREKRSLGYVHIAGVDEAGRGPLAGPVYAAAVILPDGIFIDGIDDSKKLSEKKREELFDIICENAVAYNIYSVDEKRIDEINILNATFEAMNGAVAGLSIAPDYVLIDGNRINGMDIPHETIVKGDAKSISVAAASILAKVSRDRFICKIAEQYPEYGFEKHKGYGTAAHNEAILKYGPCPIHRKTFLKKLLGEGNV